MAQFFHLPMVSIVEVSPCVLFRRVPPNLQLFSPPPKLSLQKLSRRLFQQPISSPFPPLTHFSPPQLTFFEYISSLTPSKPFDKHLETFHFKCFTFYRLCVSPSFSRQIGCLFPPPLSSVESLSEACFSEGRKPSPARPAFQCTVLFPMVPRFFFIPPPQGQCAKFSSPYNIFAF